MAGRAGANEDWTWTGTDVAAGTSFANCSLPYAARIRKNNLFAGLTGGIESIAQFTHIKANLSPLDALANHLFANPQRSLPCLARTLLMIVAIVVLWRFASRPGAWHMDDIDDYPYGLVFLLSGRCHHSAGIGRLF